MSSEKSIKSGDSPPVVAHAEFFAAALNLEEDKIQLQLGRGRPGELFYAAQFPIAEQPEIQSFWGYDVDRSMGQQLMKQLLAMGFERVEPCDYGPYAVRYA